MSSSGAEAGLTIGAVAARTGLTVPVLRAWEQRHGFPRPARLDGGHRRYDDADVARILQVVRERAAGRSLESAIALAQRTPELAPLDVSADGTLYAGLRRRRPELAAQVLTRRGMLALSHAIEDECLARADRPALTAAFQRVEAYRQALPRWTDLAKSAESTVVLAGFTGSRRRGRVHEVAIPPDAPMRREWSVVCDAPESVAVLAGWERADGRFEAVWSADPEVVRLATGVARTLAAQLAPRLALPDPPSFTVTPAAALRSATALTNRVVAYLDRSSSRVAS